MIERCVSPPKANRIDAAFIRFDYSGSGTLDASEVAAMPLGNQAARSSEGVFGQNHENGPKQSDW